MPGFLKGKSALVTGASRGIGLAVADMLASEGVNLMLNSRNITELERARDKIILKSGSKATIELFACDVAEWVKVKAMIEAFVAAFGKIDILINNAGVASHFTLLHEQSIEDINETIDTNLKGPIYTMKYALPHMVHQGEGWIININSVAGKTSFPYAGIYCASKFGLHALTESVAAEQRAINNIRVIGIYPGEVYTPIWDNVEPHVKQNPEHMLSAEDIAEAVFYALTQSANALVRDITIVPLNPANH